MKKLKRIIKNRKKKEGMICVKRKRILIISLLIVAFLLIERLSNQMKAPKNRCQPKSLALRQRRKDEQAFVSVLSDIYSRIKFTLFSCLRFMSWSAFSR